MIINEEKQCKVYVLSKDNKPLMPTNGVKAAMLLKKNIAKVVRKTPFTIKLLFEPKTNYVQPLTLGVDLGSKFIGSAVKNEINDDVIYKSQVELRDNIKDNMDRRRAYRRARRNRKTRYRKPRFLNRASSKRNDRLNPTLKSKLDNHLKEIKFVSKILPIKNIILETTKFDIHKLKNPNVKGILYQKGDLYGWENARQYVLHRDEFKCQQCKGKSKQKKLDVYHIICKSEGGSDDVENLICVCLDCRYAIQNGEIKLKHQGKKKYSVDATQANIISSQLQKKLELEGIKFETTSGHITKVNRSELKLEKSHVNDAIGIVSRGKEVKDRLKVLYKRCIADGGYQREVCVKGLSKPRVYKVGKQRGFKTFDEVLYRGNKYFIKEINKEIYTYLMDVFGNKVDFVKPKMPKLENLKIINRRKTWIMQVA
ncbi:MAG: RNA-guided endonuclease IscB [Firmicutes bacterium]|nr:RNA-guided endonuclease IscB [Bacillota bacterium]